MVGDRRERPTYPLDEAAQYLSIPRSTLRSWVYGRTYQTNHGQRFFRPVIEPADPQECLLSFYNLVEAHVLSSTRVDYRIRLKDIRAAVDYLREEFPHIPRPLISWDFYTNGKQLFVKHIEQTINASKAGQLTLGPELDRYLELIERDKSRFPLRLFLTDTERNIAVMPGIRAGRPVIVGTGIPVSIIQQRSRAGETADELVRDYGIDRAKIEAAIGFRQAA